MSHASAVRQQAGEADSRPLILHVVHRFDTGGLENGVVNLINHMDPRAYRHAVMALTDITDFRLRVLRDDVLFIALDKAPGHSFWLYPRVYRLLRQLRPAVVHTRNLGALEMVIPAWLAGVPVRVHGEHGRDISDLDGHHRGYQRLRRLYGRWVHRFVALSRDLESYLVRSVGIPVSKVAQIYNGVDTRKFQLAGQACTPTDFPFSDPGLIVIGSVGRMAEVKNPQLLAQAFVVLLQRRPELAASLRLLMCGDGPLLAPVKTLLQQAGVENLCWLPGDRKDVAALMREMDIFVLGSRAEGISNTILEAMASGLPVVATRVGGNAELVQDGQSGLLLDTDDLEALVQKLQVLVDDHQARQDMGERGRLIVEQRFSLEHMVRAYQSLYDELLVAQGRPVRI